MLIDSHIHVGQFNNVNFSPLIIHELMEKCGVNYFAVSSTTQCVELYNNVLDEIAGLIALDGDKVLPTMWITPQGLKGNIAWNLESSIKWRLLKIHPFLNKGEWHLDSDLFFEVVDIAREMNLPLLIHTGDDNFCHAKLFEKVISQNIDVIFIMAHGRPLNEAIYLSKKYANTYADSAFMPVADMKAFIDAGLSNKLLWGTDMCIPKYFRPGINLENYYKEKICAFSKIVSLEQYNQVTYLNAMKVFEI